VPFFEQQSAPSLVSIFGLLGYVSLAAIKKGTTLGHITMDASMELPWPKPAYLTATGSGFDTRRQVWLSSFQ
jgi:hypothetical protein